MDDLPLLHRWRNAPHVMEWYGKQPIGYEVVVAKYAARIRGEQPTQPYLSLYEQTPIGYIQTYKLCDYPDYSDYLALDADDLKGAAGVDLFIGAVDYLHKGLGAPLLVKFMREVVFAPADITCCVIGPEPANRAAIRMYEKAGLKHIGTVRVPGDATPTYVMRIDRFSLPHP